MSQVTATSVNDADTFAHVPGDPARIWYRASGPEWGGPVILVPSLDTTHMWFARQILELEKDRRVVVMDFTGRGKSDPAKPGTKHNDVYYASQIRAVAKDAFGEKKMFGVIAHGTGAIAAMRVYEDTPFLVSWMTLLSPFGMTRRSRMVPFKKCLCCMACCCFTPCCIRRMRRKKFTAASITDRWDRHFVDVGKVRDANRDVFDHSNQQLYPNSPFPDQIRKAKRDFPMWAPSFFREALHRVSRKRKLFIAWGAEDEIISAREMLKFGEVVPEETTSELFRGGGHAFFLERALAFNHALRAFLQRHDPVSRPPTTNIGKTVGVAEKFIKDAWESLTGTYDGDSETSVTDTQGSSWGGGWGKSSGKGKGKSGNARGNRRRKSVVENLWDSITGTEESY